MRSVSLAGQKACANDLASEASPELLAAELTSWREAAAAVLTGLGNIEVDLLDDGEAPDCPGA